MNKSRYAVKKFDVGDEKGEQMPEERIETWINKKYEEGYMLIRTIQSFEKVSVVAVSGVIIIMELRAVITITGVPKK